VSLFLVLAALMTGAAVLWVARPLVAAYAREGRSVLVPVIALAIVLPLGGAALYHRLSTFSWNPEDSAAAQAPKSVEEMVAQLERRLLRSPEDVRGWSMLGRSYFVLGRYTKSVAAYEEAYKRTEGKNGEIAANLAEALVLVDSSAMQGRAAALFEEALRDDPEQPKGLWYGGLVALQKADLPLARERFVRLLKLGPPAEVAHVLAQRIQELDVRLGRPKDPEIAALASLPGASPLPSSAPPATAAAAPAAAAGSTVHVRVGLAPALAGRVGAGDILYVLARDPDAPGPPLAVRRFPPGQSLPVELDLGPGDAMIPARSLATVRAATLVARYSRSGQPVATSGDLYGERRVEMRPGAAADILIDRAVP
jgi:cytochrome c-type biogenesis protein CcmH